MDKAELKRRVQAYGRSPEERYGAQERADGPWQSEGALGDTAVGLAAGALDIPGVVTGLADTAMALSPAAIAARYGDDEGLSGFVQRATNRPFSRAAEAVGEATGFQPGEWADTLREERYSPQMQAASEAVDESWGRVGESFEQGDWRGVASGTGRATLDMLRNPRTIQSLVTESLPQMVLGGAIGRGLSAASGTTTSLAGRPIQVATPLVGAGQASGRAVATGQAAQRMAGVTAAQTVARQTPRIGAVGGAAIGEGAVIAGATMDEIDDEVDPQRAALAALGAGAGGAAIGYAGGRLAQRMGLVDPDVALAGGGFRAGADAPRHGIVRRVAGGSLAEGFLQEMPQESLETISQNWAEGEPLLKGVPRAAISGMLAGNVMGGGANIAPPRRAEEPTNLMQTPAGGGQTALPTEGPRGPLNPQGQDLQTLKRYYRRLRRVAQDAVDHPDLQEEATQRMAGVMSALEQMGYPREVVDLELAKDRYSEAQLERDQMQRKYQEALRMNPERAPRYLQRVRERNAELAQLEEAYGQEELQSPDVATIQALQQDPDAQGYFRQRRGETTNRLKKSAQQRLTTLRDMPDEELAYEIARDEFNAQTNPDSPELKWRALRRAVSRERNLDDSLVRQVYNAEFTEEGQQAERERRQAEFFAEDGGITRAGAAPEGEAAAPPYTRMADLAADVAQGEATDPAVTAAPEAQPQAPVLTPRQQRALQAAVSVNEGGQDAFSAMLEALGEQEAGITGSTVAQRAAEMYAKLREERTGTRPQNPRQSLEEAVKGLNRQLRQRYGDDMPQFTATTLAQALAAQSEGVANPDSDLVGAETSSEQSSVSTDDAFNTGYGDTRMSGAAAIFPGGGYGTVSSVGGSQVSQQERAETKKGVKKEVNAALNTAIGKGVELEDARVRAQAWLDEYAANEGMNTDEVGAAEQQLATATNKLELRRALMPVRDRAVEVLTDRATGAMPSRPQYDQVSAQREQERQQQIADIARAAEAGRQQALADAALVLESSIAQRAGNYWDRLLHRVPENDRISWDEFSETQPVAAANWANQVYLILNSGGDADIRPVLVEAFMRDFAGNMQETYNADQAIPQRPEPARPALADESAGAGASDAAPEPSSQADQPAAESAPAPDAAESGQGTGADGRPVAPAAPATVDADYLSTYNDTLRRMAAAGQQGRDQAGADIMASLMAEAPVSTGGERNASMDRALSMAQAYLQGVEGRQAEPAAPAQEAQPQPEISGDPTVGAAATTYLPDNTPIQTRWRVVELDDLVVSNRLDLTENPDFPPELQPRARGDNVNLSQQVQTIVARFNPERLGASPEAGAGSPIIGPDNVAETGNGRLVAIGRVYRANGRSAGEYRQFVAQQAAANGISPDVVAQMSQPVLVRERTSTVDRARFVRQANDRTTAGMSAYEQAISDSSMLSPEDLQAWSPDQSGDPLAASNRPFIRMFLQNIVGSSDAAQYTDRDGNPTQELAQRMQRAVFARAYRDADNQPAQDLVELVTEDTDQMKNLARALESAAANLAEARESGSQLAQDVVDTIIAAVRLVRQSRRDGVAIEELVNQTDAFAEEIAAPVRDLALGISSNMRSRAALERAFGYIGQAALQESGSQGDNMFGDTITEGDIINEGVIQAQPEGRRRAEPAGGSVQQSELGDAGQGQDDLAQGAAPAEQTQAPVTANAADTSAQRVEETAADRQVAFEEGVDPIAGYRLRDHIASGKRPAYQINQDGEGVTVVTAGTGMSDIGSVQVTLTPDEARALKQAQQDRELADTTEEIEAARAAVRAAVTPAIERAVGLNESTPPLTPETQTEQTQAPVVRTRGRRGRRQGDQQLQPGRAATAEDVQQAIDNATENPGPEASERIAIAISQASESRRQAAMDVRTSQEQVDIIQAFLEYQSTGEATVQGVLDRVDAIIGTDHPLYALSQVLRAHPSTQNVRFTPDQPVRRDNVMGYYIHALHAININPTYWGGVVLDLDFDTLSSASQQDMELAETILHELVHAATSRALRTQGPNQQGPEAEALRQRMREVYLQVRSYLEANPDEFSGSERGAIEYMFSDEFEFMSMAMTSPEAQRILKAVPASDSYNGNMFGRFVQAVLDFFGLTDTSPTALEEALSIVSDVMYIEASTTQKFLDQTRANNTLLLSDMSAPFDNLRIMQEARVEGAEAFVEELVARMEAVDAAEMRGDAEAKAVALEGLRRVSQSIQEYTNRLVSSTNERPQSLLTASERPAPDTLSDRLYDSAVNRAPSQLKNMLSDLKNRIKGLTYLSSFSHDFVDMVRKYLPQAETYFTTIFNRLSERNEMHVEIQRIVDPVGSLSNKQRDAMNTVLREMTYQEAWAFQPDWVQQQVTVDPVLARKFEALPEAAQTAAINMFRYAQESNAAIQQQLRNDIITTYDAYIEKAKSNREEDKRIEEKARALREHDDRQLDPSVPYLPLKRWGEWAVVHKSERFRQAEDAGNRSTINQLKQDPNHYQVVFAESEYAARQERDRMEQELGVTVEDPFQRMRYDQSNEVIPFDLMTRLREEAIGRTEGREMSEVDRRVAAAVDRMYIAALEESSVRKSELRRLKVEGAGRDMVRAFIEHGQGLAALSSALKINKETRRVIQQMKQHATDPKAGRQRNDRMMALNEVLARHAVSLEMDTRDNWQQRVMGYTSIWMLLTSPAYFIQNSTQPFMLTYPVLSAKFGANKSMGFMRKAYSTVMAARRDTKADGTEGLMDPAKLTDPREQMLFTRLQRLGLLDVGIAADLGTLRQGRGPIGKGFYAVHHKMLTAVRWVEVYNRGVTAIASFRLERQRLMGAREAGNNQLSDSAIDEAAMKYATHIVQTTQGDYSGPNAPRLIDKLPAGRLLTQFRKFQLIQIGLLTRTFHQAFKNADAGERAIGRRQLTYILGMHAMMGGALGLPAANIIGYAVAKAFGDDDEPADAELLARRLIGNKEVADLILRGLPASLGVDASTRLGMGLTFSIMPFADISASRDGFYVMLGNLLGPTVGLGSMFADGAGQIAQGNVAMGMTQFMPAGVKNAMKAYLYKTDGVRRRNGDLALSAEELSWFSTVTQGLGWPGTQITDRYFATGAVIKVDEHFRSRTSKIKRAYTEAYRAGDREGMSEARQAWMDLQAMRREYGFGNPQPVSQLIRAPREQRERERLMVEGVAARRTQQRFVESLFE